MIYIKKYENLKIIMKRLLVIFIMFSSIIITNNVYAQADVVGGAQFDTHPMHWARFWARGLFDRNLIWCPVWNIGNVTDSHVEPSKNLTWPGSQGLTYVGYANFYIGAKVIDLTDFRGKVVPYDEMPPLVSNGEHEISIVSDAYLPHVSVGTPAQISRNDDHQQIWAPIPGFYNDGKFGWIWGINEDTDGDGELSPQEDVNYNGNLDYNLEPPPGLIKSIAISTDKRTWPEYWPGGSYIGDTRPYFDRPPRTTSPGTRAGKWNGEYKAGAISDQETIYRMDDHENDYWNEYTAYNYWPKKNPDGSPDTEMWKEGGIAGAGIEVESRSYAWFHPLAEDLLVSVYRVRNYSDYQLNHVVTGMWSDANIAGQSEFNGADYIKAEYTPDGTPQGEAKRLEFDILYQWHTKPQDLSTYKKIGHFGFAFLESPGISYNGEDDDKDGYIDESMEDGIDNDGDWLPYADIGLDRKKPGDPGYEGPDLDGTEGNGVWDTEDQNFNGALDNGEDINKNDKLDMEPVNDDRGVDGIGPDENGWPGPDADGTECNGNMELGEPNFDLTDIDEADQAGLKHIFVYNSDKILMDQRVFWAKYLDKPGEDVIETDEDICFTFGAKGVKLEKMEWQRFTIALIMGEDRDDAVRNKATMQDIYDHNYRFLTPPLQPTLVANVKDREVQLYWDTDAEYSKDPFFGEDFNGYRVYKSTDPKFLDIKTVTDAFGNVLLFKPLAIYDRIDGLKGAHPVPFPNMGVHYDMGNDTGLRHSYRDTLVHNGRTYFYAVNAIDAGNDWDFGPEERKLVTEEYPMQAMPSESPFNITVNTLGEVVYRDRNTAVCIPVEPAAGFREPLVDSMKVEHISGIARGGQWAIKVFNKDHVKLGHQYELTFEDDSILYERTNREYMWGNTKAVRCINLTTSDTLFDLKYNNPLQFTQNAYNEIEKSIFEGLHFAFNWPIDPRDLKNHGISIIKENAEGRATNEWKRWVTSTPSNLRVQAIEPGRYIALPIDVELRIGDYMGVDTSLAVSLFVPAIPINFTTWDVTDPENPRQMKVKIVYDKSKVSISPEERAEMTGQIWDSTRVILTYFDTEDNRVGESWTMRFYKNQFDIENPVIPPAPGDIYRFKTYRNPTHLDTLRFVVEKGKWSRALAQSDMKDIYVVPDPYVVSSTIEPIYELAGYTQRRIDFVNLPPNCTIQIFTVSGKLVKKLEHNAQDDFGRESWDLTTEDGSEVAFGIYFFAVDAKDIGIQRGKFAIIK